MSRQRWDRETWLDVTVNLVPIAVLFVFLGLFLVVTPWGLDTSLASLSQFALVISMILITAYLTYVTAERLAE
jgi:hypothetical protein